MARQRRLNEPGSYHHITARGVDRQSIFLDDGDRRQFLALVRESHQRFGCRILAFCLMDNHIHLTVLDDHGTLSKTLHFLNGVYAKKFNVRHGRTGHLFERRFWSSMLDSDAYLSTCVKYVHRNPLEAGLVDRLEDHRWSSYPSYIGARATPTFLDTEVVMTHYGNDQTLFRSATEVRADDEPLIRQLASPNPPSRLGATAASTATPSAAATPVALDTVLDTCAAIVGVGVDEILERRPGRRNEARDLVAFVSHRHAGHVLKDIAPALGLSSAAAVSLACERFAGAESERNQRLLEAALRTLDLNAPTS